MQNTIFKKNILYQNRIFFLQISYISGKEIKPSIYEWFSYFPSIENNNTNVGPYVKSWRRKHWKIHMSFFFLHLTKLKKKPGDMFNSKLKEKLKYLLKRMVDIVKEIFQSFRSSFSKYLLGEKGNHSILTKWNDWSIGFKKEEQRKIKHNFCLPLRENTDTRS